jgi:hypothetical protein
MNKDRQRKCFDLSVLTDLYISPLKVNYLHFVRIKTILSTDSHMKTPALRTY